MKEIKFPKPIREGLRASLFREWIPEHSLKLNIELTIYTIVKS